VPPNKCLGTTVRIIVLLLYVKETRTQVSFLFKVLSGNLFHCSMSPLSSVMPLSNGIVSASGIKTPLNDKERLMEHVLETFGYHTKKKFAIFNSHCVLSCGVRRQLKHATDTNLNVWTHHVTVIRLGPVDLGYALECLGGQWGGFEIMNELCIFSTSSDKFQYHFLYCMELRSLDICRTLPISKPLHSVPTSALFASLWLALSEKENVEHMNVHFRGGPHLHNAEHKSFRLRHFSPKLTARKLAYDKARIHFGWMSKVIISNISKKLHLEYR
jgi:hypothetical protein